MEKAPKNNSQYIYVNDMKNKKTTMSVDKFSGMIFKFCFDFHGTSSWYDNPKPYTSDVSVIEALLKYKFQGYIAKFHFRIQIFDANQFLVDILNGPNEDSRVIYRIQFNHMTPILIENHIDLKFIKSAFKNKG